MSVSVPDGEALSSAVELAQKLASFPQTGLRHDRLNRVGRRKLQQRRRQARQVVTRSARSAAARKSRAWIPLGVTRKKPGVRAVSRDSAQHSGTGRDR